MRSVEERGDGSVRRSRGVVDEVAAGLAVVMGGARYGFRVDRTVIPAGIRCDRCRACHLPARVIAEYATREGRARQVVRLRCPRCAAVSEVAVDGRPENAELLDVLGVDWRGPESLDSSSG